MKLIIFSGFLGAGKTVSVISLAQFLAKTQPQKGDTRAVIIENEIGDVSYDSSLLRRDGYEIIDMLSGCICCSMGADLLVQLREIVPWYNPEYVIVEPTGLAFPENIADIAATDQRDIEWMKIVCIVDAERYYELMEVTPGLITAQIKAANLVIVSKTDLIPADEQGQLLDDIRSLVESDTEVVNAVIPAGIDDEIWEELIQDYK
jgi:G3E family GTPase